MSSAAGMLRTIGGKLKLSDVISGFALLFSLPAILLSIDQLMNKNKTEKEAELRIAQAEQQIRYTKDQVEQSRLQSESAKLSAAAAANSVVELRQQNDFARQVFLYQRYNSYQSARPRIDFIEVDKIDFSDVGPSKWSAKFAKSGLPPSNVRIWTFSAVQKSGTSVQSYPDCKSDSYTHRGTFQNGSVFNDGPKILYDQRDLLEDGRYLFVIGGRICYSDDDGGWHATDFCIAARGTKASWTYNVCSGMNGSYTLQLPAQFEELTGKSVSK